MSVFGQHFCGGNGPLNSTRITSAPFSISNACGDAMKQSGSLVHGFVIRTLVCWLPLLLLNRGQEGDPLIRNMFR